MLKELSEPAGAIIYCSRFKVNMEKDTFFSFSFYLAALVLPTVWVFFSFIILTCRKVTPLWVCWSCGGLSIRRAMPCCSAHLTETSWRGSAGGRSVPLTLWETSQETERQVSGWVDRAQPPKSHCNTFKITVVFLFAQIVLVDDEEDSTGLTDRGRCPVDLQLEWVLGKMPQKEFKMERLPPKLQSLVLPAGLSIRDALERVLRLPAVASKRYLTNKVCVLHLCSTSLQAQYTCAHSTICLPFQVDRSVTGLVAQQQCVGPLHTPLADVAVVALSPFSLEGAATSIGEQPVKGLVCPAAGARMAVGEALTNLVFARVTALKVIGWWVQKKHTQTGI